MISRDKLKEILDEYIPYGNTFVEIGAYDGETNSNTCNLADSGWVGFYYEPVEEYAKKCSERHKNNNVFVFPFGIGEQGIKDFYVSEQLSTLNGLDYQNKVKELEWFKTNEVEFKKIEVQIVSANVLPTCDLLVVDVEGKEYDILKEMKIRPKVLVVELHEDSKEWNKIVNPQNSIALLNEMGYNQIYKDDVDSIFVYA